MFRMILMSLFTIVNSQLPGSQVDLTGHGCVLDGGYEWCEELSRCIRRWEVPCPSLNSIGHLPCSEPCPPALSCPNLENTNNCIIRTHTDRCNCETSCPSYDCSIIICNYNSDCNNGRCMQSQNGDFFECVENQVTIPENCATFYDGCNTCQVRNGEPEICTLMYCYTTNTPYCMSYHIEPNSLQIGDVCYRFCEDGSQVSINRKSDCPINTICSNPIKNSEINFDSCNTREWICENSGH